MSQVLAEVPVVEEILESNLDRIPENIRGHIREITNTSGLEESEESVEKIAESWLEKEKIFEEQMSLMDMEEVECLDGDSPDGALAMTWSGSLVNIGPLKEETRNVEYSSIGLRSDVPESATCEDSRISSSISRDSGIEFTKGPVQATSPIHKIAICRGNLEAEEQEERINSATQVLKDEFVNVNRTIVLDD